MHKFALIVLVVAFAYCVKGSDEKSESSSDCAPSTSDMSGIEKMLEPMPPMLPMQEIPLPPPMQMVFETPEEMKIEIEMLKPTNNSNVQGNFQMSSSETETVDGKVVKDEHHDDYVKNINGKVSELQN